MEPGGLEGEIEVRLYHAANQQFVVVCLRVGSHEIVHGLTAEMLEAGILGLAKLDGVALSVGRDDRPGVAFIGNDGLLCRPVGRRLLNSDRRSERCCQTR